MQETFPRKAPKVAGQLRRGAAFVAVRAGDEAVLLRTRPPTGLLGAMAEPPTSDWTPDYDPARALLDAPLDARWKRLPGVVRHGFTHFPLELTVFTARVAAGTVAPDDMRFTAKADLDAEPLPGAMRKVLAHALGPSSAPKAKPTSPDATLAPPTPGTRPRGRPRKVPTPTEP